MLRFTAGAIADVDGIHAFIAEANPTAADAVVSRIDVVIQGLLRFPERGRVGRVSGTRELVAVGLSYIVAYAITGDDIEILAVLHGARALPASFSVVP